MTTDPGYCGEPWASLCADLPGEDVYPPADFRTEWGAVLHRGRLDGSAQVLVVGQDPAAQEAFARRILVGLAGQRVQGLLARLGITRSYTMLNTFAYSVVTQDAGERHRKDARIALYRERWLDAVADRSPLCIVLALGALAGDAATRWQDRRQDPAVTVRRVLHPTYPESAAASGQISLSGAMARLCADWNDALDQLRPLVTRPDDTADPRPYGDALTDDDLRPIPAADLPPGLPAWACSGVRWAERAGTSDDERRATLVITVPQTARHWT